MRMFISMLLRRGMKAEDIRQMSSINPSRLLGLD
jgi:predicted metal-dependent phosphotriesterase family hydrolase